MRAKSVSFKFVPLSKSAGARGWNLEAEAVVEAPAIGEAVGCSPACGACAG